VGEVGEVANLIKRVECYGSLHKNGQVITTDEIGDELADIQAYLDLLAQHFGIDLGEATRRKFNAVSKRRGVEVFL
jgi:NTP pyrophosphatase (non-canonical NTP hydrolase)